MCTIRLLVRDLSRFFMYALSAISFPLRTTFIVFYNLGMLCISFYWILGSLQYFSMLMSSWTFLWAQSCSVSMNLYVCSWIFFWFWYPILIYSDLIGCRDLFIFLSSGNCFVSAYMANFRQNPMRCREEDICFCFGVKYSINITRFICFIS